MRRALIFLALVLSASISAIGQATNEKAAAQPRMISVGDRRVAVYCDGAAGRSPTVILIPGGGRPAQDWEKVQPAVASFARVCSYDPPNIGASDRAPANIQSPDEALADLHTWLKASGEKGPFILVGHSGGGMFARRFGAKFPSETAGLVFVDSSHEEQYLRLREIDPEGPEQDEFSLRLGFYVKPGERLQWKTDLPLIVLGRGKPFPRRARDGSDSQTNRMTEEQFAAWDRAWRGFQEDLAKRSTHGELRVAKESGHFIQWDQPELIIQAIRDLTRSR